MTLSTYQTPIIAACFCVGPPGNCPCARRAREYEKLWNTQPAPVAVGWICPKCGRGNAPTCQTCICQPMPAPVIT